MKISDVFSSLIAAYHDWSKYLGNPNFIHKGQFIAWPKYEKVFISNVDDFLEASEKRQYSFQILADGAILQLFYVFDSGGKNLIFSFMGYYKGYSSYLIKDQEIASVETSGMGGFEDSGEEELDIQIPELQGELKIDIDQVLMEECNDLDSIIWLRIDFDPDRSSGVLHGECHLHISNFPDSRILVKGVPTPKQFVEFIMALCYPAIYQLHRLGGTGNYRDLKRVKSINSPIFPPKNEEIYSHLSHIRVPGH